MKTFYSEEGKKSVTFPVKETKFCFGICRNFALPVFRDTSCFARAMHVSKI